MSFNTVNELAVHMYARNSSHKDFAEVPRPDAEDLPDLKQGYYPGDRRRRGGALTEP